MNTEALQLANWTSSGLTTGDGVHFMFDRGTVPNHLRGIHVVLESGGLPRARLRLAAGARQVLLGDLAVNQASLVKAALEEFGPERFGAWLPVRRAPVSWALDSHSNGDFKCMVPSNPQARWEVLRSDRQPVGLDAVAWIGKLAACGLRTILVGIDMEDDRDLDLCAGLMEDHGPRLWFTPLGRPAADFASWVEYGQVRRLVLPAAPARSVVARELMERFGRKPARSELPA